MKITINPLYEHLREFVENIPSTFEEQGDVVQAKRNVIKVLEVNGLKVNIKRYRKPILFNRFVYSFIRETKAKKAYQNALKVIQRGFETPRPIAYIEEYSGGLLSLSYFISTQIEDVREIREYYYTKAETDEDQRLLTAFARYTAQLHNANIFHQDYSPGNILIAEQDEQFQFSIVDINRMQFREIDLEASCESFCRLFEYDEAILFVAKEYASVRCADVAICTKMMLYFKHNFEQKKERKKRLKQFFGKNK